MKSQVKIKQVIEHEQEKRKKIEKLDRIKIKTVCFEGHCQEKGIGRNMQLVYLMRDWYREQDTYSSATPRQATPFKNGQKI